ncbi:AfsR/SARP family transcriptional regulator [Kitasatospora sp. NPDC088391]|uniref:AfsR/SARP family transcriptional regulator n=1 Tax=Kitasatospora sp. NPDC088391 TaxID=3364074 RepID=UPI0037F7E18C
MPIGSRKTRIVLACLALDLERPLSLTALADRLWDGEPPQSFVSTLQGHLSRLRTALREAQETDGGSGGRPAELVSRSGTYTLHAEPDRVDWRLYHRLAVDARALAEAGDDRRALAALDRAARAWRGEPLAGLPGLWAQQVRGQLRDRRFATTLVRHEIELRLGRFADLVPDLAELADEHPWNEQVAAQLMTALYGCGRVDEAVDAYRRLQRRMYADLATAPGEPLNRLLEGILRRDRAADLVARPAGPPAVLAPPPAPGPARRPSTLPPPPELVGRDVELDLLIAAGRGEWPTAGRSAALPVVALSGQPGCGKTALALTAAHRLRADFPDGAFLLRLATHTPARPDPGPEAAATALLRLLGVPAPEIPLDPDELLARCRELLSQRRALVVLDDAAGPGQIGPLLPAEPTSFVLVTARRRMAELPALSTVPLDTLAPAASAAMFSRLAGPDRAADPGPLADVTRRCAHLPLALHLAAGRFRSRSSWDLAHLADRLSRNDRLGELRHGTDSLHAALSMSYHDLSADHQIALRRLSLHPGSDFGLLTAAALVDCPPDRAEHLIEELLAVNLLAEHGIERFGFHELVREYAADREAHEEPRREHLRTIGRSVNFLLWMADHTDRAAHPDRFRLPLRALSPELAEEPAPVPPEALRTVRAHSWLAAETETLLDLEKDLRTNGDPESAAVLAHLLAGRLDAEGLWPEAIGIHRAAAEHWRARGAEAPELHALLALSAVRSKVGRHPDAEHAARRALHLARTTADPRGTAESLGHLAQARWRQGDLPAALALQEEALSVLHELGAATATATANIGLLHGMLGDDETALHHLTEALADFRARGDRAAAVRTTMNIGGIHLRAGNHTAARNSLEFALQNGSGVVPVADMAAIRLNLAEIMSAAGEIAPALAVAEECLQVFHRLGILQRQAEAMNFKGMLLLRSGDPESAGEAYAGALAVARSIGSPQDEAAARCGLARTAEQMSSAGGTLGSGLPAAGGPGARAVRFD